MADLPAGQSAASCRSDIVYVGAMAQEVALLHPDAVARDPLTGYLAVDYARLGLRPMMLNE